MVIQITVVCLYVCEDSLRVVVDRQGFRIAGEEGGKRERYLSAKTIPPHGC